jgi:hypothetical protein
VNAKKNKLTVQPKPTPTSAGQHLISLKPSTSDYATFVRTTSQVLGTTGPASRKTKPSKLVLSLANMES